MLTINELNRELAYRNLWTRFFSWSLSKIISLASLVHPTSWGKPRNWQHRSCLNPPQVYFCLSIDTSNGLEVLANIWQVGGTEVIVEGTIWVDVAAVLLTIGVVGFAIGPVEVLLDVQPDVAVPLELTLARQVVQADPRRGSFQACRTSFIHFI